MTSSDLCRTFVAVCPVQNLLLSEGVLSVNYWAISPLKLTTRHRRREGVHWVHVHPPKAEKKIGGGRNL